MNLNDLLSLLEKNINMNAQNEIKKITNILIKNLKNIQNIEILNKIAFLFEQASLSIPAKLVYQRILHINPNNIEILYKLAIVLIDSCDDDTAEKYLKKIIEKEPNNEKAKQELNDIYYRKEEFGFTEKLNISNETERIYLSEDYVTAEDFIPDFNDSHIKKFLKLFRSRNDVYSEQWIDNKFNVGYKPVYNILNENIVANHFSGNKTLGMYCMNKDNTVKWAVIDLDINKKSLNNSLDDKKKLYINIYDAVNKIYNTCMRYGIYPVIENSGNKGAHLWFFFEQNIKAIIVRNFLKKIVSKSDISEIKNINFEIFPKQDELKNKKLGNLVKLPLGIHKKTLKRCLFTDFKGNYFNNQFDYLLSINNYIGEKIMIKIIEQNNKKKNIKDTEIIKIVKTDEEPEGNPFQNEELVYLTKKCSVINYLIEKLKNERLLTYEEKLSLIYSISFLKDGKKLVENLLVTLIDFKESDIKKFITAVASNPVSCNKIRKRIKPWKLGLKCDCNFFFDNRSYPTPVLHLKQNELGEKLNVKNDYKKYDDIVKQDINIIYKNRLKNI